MFAGRLLALKGAALDFDLTAAYSAAKPGSTILLPAAAVSAAELRGGSGVTVQGQPGTVVADLALFGVQNFVLRDTTVTDSVTLKPLDGQTGQVCDGVKITNVKTGLFYSRNTANLYVNGGQWGPSKGISPTIGSYTTAPVSKNVTIDRVHITGISRDPGQHVEGIFVQDVTNFVLSDSRFDNNAVYDFSIGGLNAATENYLVRNCFFGATTDGYYAGQVTDANTSQPSTGRFEGCTFEQGIYNPSSPVSGCGNVKAGSFDAWPANFDGPCGTPPPPPGPSFDDLYRAVLKDLRAGTLWAGYAKANPRESGRVNTWLDAPTQSFSPSVATATGRFLVGVGSMYLKGR